MKIAFVSSCFDPGRDGVGDYATLLAESCAERGHSVARLALNDSAAEERPGLLRLERGMDWRERTIRARAWLEAFAPDWISLHFVCYGFHPRGLVGAVAPHLSAILRGFPVHVYFHELWIGEESGAPLKHRLVGWLQRRGVLGLLRQLDIRHVATSNPGYVYLLGRRGIAAGRLPLFGSLPLPARQSPRDPATITLVFFGSLHPVWRAEPLFQHLQRLDRRISIVHTGRIGEGAALWEHLVREYGDRFSFNRAGERSPAELAKIFAASDFGVSATPWALIGKSASVAAMLDAGLPVIVNRDDIRYPGQPAIPNDDPLLLPMTSDFESTLRSAKRQPPRLRRPEVAEQFLAELAAAGETSV